MSPVTFAFPFRRRKREMKTWCPNIVSLIEERGLGRIRAEEFIARCVFPERRQQRLSSCCDLFDPSPSTVRHCLIKKRSPICQILKTEGIVLALTASGICCILEQLTFECIGVLNTDPLEAIRAIVVNKPTASVLSVSAHRTDGFNALCCRATKVRYVPAEIPPPSQRWAATTNRGPRHARVCFIEMSNSAIPREGHPSSRLRRCSIRDISNSIVAIIARSLSPMFRPRSPFGT